MANLYLIARKLSSSPVGNQYMLAVWPNPNLGLSLTPITDHSYPTLDDLCALIDDCDVLPSLEVAALRFTLDKGDIYTGLIDEEAAICMGFKLSA